MHQRERERCGCGWIVILLVILSLPVLLPGPIQDAFRSLVSGVEQFSSADAVTEMEHLTMRLLLQPGMAICEMGSGDGTLISQLGRQVMPGGRLVATAPGSAELAATRYAVTSAGLRGVDTFKATDSDWASGLEPGSCDVIYSRMVYHMIPKATGQSYIPQFAAALKPGGKLLMLDHNPMDGRTDGPRRPIAKLFGWAMPVVPQDTLIAEFVAPGDFTLEEGPFDWPFFANGYGALFTLRAEQNVPTSLRRPYAF